MPLAETTRGSALLKASEAGPISSVEDHPILRRPVLELCASDIARFRIDRGGIQDALVERLQELPQGLELDRLGPGQQLIDAVIVSRLDRRGHRVAKLGCARIRSFEQPHSLEQALVASNDLCQDVREALGRDILAPEHLEHSGQRLIAQVERGTELAYAGVGLQNRAACRFPGQTLQIHRAEGPLDGLLEFGRSGAQVSIALDVGAAAGRNTALVGDHILARGIAGRAEYNRGDRVRRPGNQGARGNGGKEERAGYHAGSQHAP